MTDYKVAKLGYVAFGVPNLDDAVDFYRRAVRLSISERKGDTVFMTGDLNHHWIRLQENAPPGVLRIGYQLVSEQALEDVKADLSERGLPFKENVANLAEDRIENSIRFQDPGGVEVELFTKMAELAVDPVSPGVKLEKLLHVVWKEPDVLRAHQFYGDVLGFKTSDWIERNMVFMHNADQYHHGIAIINSQEKTWEFNHFCVLVDSIDDVMRYRHNAVKLGITLRDDVLRHGPSGSISVYIFDPILGHAVEYCTSHPKVDDETYEPRTLPGVPWSLNIWKSPLPEMTSDEALPIAALRS